MSGVRIERSFFSMEEDKRPVREVAGKGTEGGKGSGVGKNWDHLLQSTQTLLKRSIPWRGNRGEKKGTQGQL